MDRQGTVPPGLEEIVVTAERRPEFAQSAPLALTVVSGEELAKEGISQPEDLGKLIPGLTITNTAITTISIRGVGTVTEFDSLAHRSHASRSRFGMLPGLIVVVAGYGSPAGDAVLTNWKTPGIKR
jgi:outer membrane receptor protein involved in Fe transport